MKKIFNKLKLSKEAYLLDSYLYILKSMIAISFGAILGNMFSLTRLDMISVLLGVMYNLEVTNKISLKGGMNQLLTSTLGAISTGTLVYFFGVNPIVIALGMGITLFISLKIDYKLVSPVAIFTSIYMTQYLQSNTLGEASVFLTFRLRIAALGLGILIALFFNLIFSFVYYKKMVRKRLEYTKIKTIDAINESLQYFKDSNNKKDEFNMFFANIFTDIETISYQINSLIDDPLYKYTKKDKEDLYTSLNLIKTMKAIVHFSYDIVYIFNNQSDKYYLFDKKEVDLCIESLSQIIDNINSIDYLKIENTNLNLLNKNKFFNNTRISENINLIEEETIHLIKLTEKLITT